MTNGWKIVVVVLCLWQVYYFNWMREWNNTIISQYAYVTRLKVNCLGKKSVVYCEKSYDEHDKYMNNVKNYNKNYLWYKGE